MTNAIFLGTDTGAKRIAVRPKLLTTHTAILGMTGSGKTGLVLGIVEELVRNKIPSVILDIKGDMANVLLREPPALEMMPRIITPGATHGESVDVTAGLASPYRLSEAVTALLRLVGVKSDPIKSKPHAYISEILKDRMAKRQSCKLLDLVVAVQDPPFEMLGAMDVDEVMPMGVRKGLAGKLNNILVAPTFENWRTGTGLNMDELTRPLINSTPVVIYSVAHLANDDERTFAISLLFDEMVTWMRRQPGANDLKAAFIVDECYGLMPPKGGSQTKTALLTMLKQGRAAGLGVVLASQNPMDIDYKGMANCGTWILGRLQTANDRKRIVEGICSAVPGMEKKKLEGKVGGLRPRQFLLARGTNLQPFYSRDVKCDLAGPMDPAEIKALLQRYKMTQGPDWPADILWKG